VVEHEWFDNAVKMQKYQVIREMSKLGKQAVPLTIVPPL
jgi:hypothetical protein